VLGAVSWGMTWRRSPNRCKSEPVLQLVGLGLPM